MMIIPAKTKSTVCKDNLHSQAFAVKSRTPLRARPCTGIRTRPLNPLRLEACRRAGQARQQQKQCSMPSQSLLLEISLHRLLLQYPSGTAHVACRIT